MFVCMYALTCMSGARRGQKKASGPKKLVVNHHVCSGRGIRVLCKNSHEMMPVLFSVGLPISIQSQDSPNRHVHGSARSRQFLMKTFFPTDSMLCQVDS